MRIRRYIITRILLALPMIFIIVTVTFLLLRVLPGNPALSILGEDATPDAVAALEERLGLNKPISEQLVIFWISVLRGELGTSLRFQTTVVAEIISRFPITLELVIGGMFFGNLIAIFIGVESARRGGTANTAAKVYSVLGYCVPIFWLGMLFQIFFGIYLDLFPIQGILSPAVSLRRITGSIILDSILTGNLRALVDGLHHYALPWLILALWYSAINSRVLRSDMTEVLLQDYIVTARAKGLSESTVTYKHALRNALIPLLTLMGLQFARALSGVILTETVFNIPGMGRLLYESVLDRDYPIIQGLILTVTTLVAIILVIVDILLAYIDPRIKY